MRLNYYFLGGGRKQRKLRQIVAIIKELLYGPSNETNSFGWLKYSPQEWEWGFLISYRKILKLQNKQNRHEFINVN